MASRDSSGISKFITHTDWTDTTSLQMPTLLLQVISSGGQICCQRKVLLVFYHLVGCDHPKKLEIKG